MHRLSIKNMHKIWEDQNTGNALYLGDYYAASNINKLREANITAVLTVAAGLGIDHSGTNIKHKVFNAWDMPSYNISRHFQDAYDFIDLQIQKGSILVHCAAGISRSSTIVIMYLMKKVGWNLKNTISQVRLKRSIIAPNPGFLRHLQNYQKTLNLNKQKNDSKMTQSKINKQSSLTASFLSKTKPSTFQKMFENPISSLKTSQIKVSSMSKSYCKPQSQKLDRISKISRPFSIQKPSRNNIDLSSKRSSIPSWKRFINSTQSVAPRIITIKP